MKRLFYAGGSVLTGDQLADAVIRLGRALGIRGQVSVADIPIIDDAGVQGRAQLLLGRGSQLMSVTSSTSKPEVEEPGTVETLDRLASDSATTTVLPLDTSERLVIDELDW
jgi:hypothetical protein